MNELAAKVISQWQKDEHPIHSGVAKAFEEEMRGKEYGYEETLDAWEWFKAGYMMAVEKYGVC